MAGGADIGGAHGATTVAAIGTAVTVVMVASVYNIFKNNFANLMFLRVISLKMRVDTKVLLVEAQ